VYGAGTDLAFAFLCDRQPDPPRTSIAIGDCVAEVRVAVGEPVHLAGSEAPPSLSPGAAV
jgi:hypothetical protein